MPGEQPNQEVLEGVHNQPNGEAEAKDRHDASSSVSGFSLISHDAQKRSEIEQARIVEINRQMAENHALRIQLAQIAEEKRQAETTVQELAAAALQAQQEAQESRQRIDEERVARARAEADAASEREMRLRAKEDAERAREVKARAEAEAAEARATVANLEAAKDKAVARATRAEADAKSEHQAREVLEKRYDPAEISKDRRRQGR